MYRRVLYIAIVIVTLGIALSLTYVVASFPHLRNDQNQDEHQHPVVTVSPTPSFTFGTETSEMHSPCSDPVENGRVSFFAICTNDPIEYKGIRIERLYSKQEGTFAAVVKRGKHVLARHGEDLDLLGHDFTFFALFPMLGDGEKQLIIVQSSGGAHCCFHYWIYALNPTFRLIFDGTKYGIGDGFDPITFQDLDGDGSLEFTQKIITFDYWLDCYTCTPQPTMVFKYDRRRHKYIPANHRFLSYALKDMRGDIRELEALMKEPKATRDLAAIEYRSFDVLLSYIYAGKERQGWRLYGRFARWDGDVEWRRKLRKQLKADSLYRFLYSH